MTKASACVSPSLTQAKYPHTRFSQCQYLRALVALSLLSLATCDMHAATRHRHCGMQEIVHQDLLHSTQSCKLTKWNRHCCSVCLQIGTSYSPFQDDEGLYSSWDGI